MGGVIVDTLHSPHLISRTVLRLAAAGLLLLSGFGSSVFAQQNIGELYATDARVKGAVILAGSGTSVLSGSQITAGAETATLKLERGGDVLVCPGTNLSVTASQSGRQFLFSVNSGNLELNYPIGSASDSLLTPDFRLLLPGPGRIHLAMRIDASGDTCVQSLPNNSSAVVVSEAMGDESYQVKQDDAVLFKGGHIQGATRTRQSCGCPASLPVQVAAVKPPPPAPAPKPPPTSGAALSEAQMPLPASGVAVPETQATPPAKAAASDSGPTAPPPDVANAHLSVEAPFVFHGEDTPPDLTEIVAHLKLENTLPFALNPVVIPPEQQGKAKATPQEQTTAGSKEQSTDKRGVFSKIGAFFASIFH